MIKSVLNKKKQKKIKKEKSNLSKSPQDNRLPIFLAYFLLVSFLNTRPVDHIWAHAVCIIPPPAFLTWYAVSIFPHN